MNKDLTFLEMMPCAMSGESSSVAIENQEKRGQWEWQKELIDIIEGS